MILFLAKNGFNLSPSVSRSNNNIYALTIQEPQSGTFSIELKFKSATPKTLTLVVIGEFSRVLSIDSDRQVAFA